MKALKRKNEALPGLIRGIIGYGLIVLGVGIIFAPDKVQFASGLAVGIGCAIFMAIHIASVLNDAMLPGGSPRILAAKSVMRYIIVVIIFFVMTYFKLGNFIAAFIGIMGLKVSAYIQQFKRRG